jgi:hypothetical protein
MRVHFMHDWDHVTPERTISFKGGADETVTKEIGDAAVKAKAATRIKEEKGEGGESK